MWGAGSFFADAMNMSVSRLFLQFVVSIYFAVEMGCFRESSGFGSATCMIISALDIL